MDEDELAGEGEDLTISAEQVSVPGKLAPARCAGEADVAEICANYRDHGIGFFARIGERACAVCFHSSYSRSDAIAKATRYARDVMHARETRVRI